MTDSQILTLRGVSEWLGVPEQTLYRWRWEGKGPVGFRAGRGVRYRAVDVEAWIEEQIANDA